MTNSFIGTYAPDDMTIVLSKGAFTHTITGFGDGSFISMERLVPTSDPYIGAGDNAFGRTKRRITALNVNITLHQYSPSNTVLQQLQLADANTPGNEWVFNCLIVDPSGQTKMSTSSAIIIAPPTINFGTSTETRDWTIYMFGSDLFIGGNIPLSDQEVAAMEALGGSVDERWKLSNQ